MHMLALLALSYVFIPGPSNNVISSNIDLNRALAIRDQYGAHFLWVKHDGVGYVIRDAATLAEIDHLFDAARAYSPELEQLRKKMRPLEKRQDRLEREADAISDDDYASQHDRERLRDLQRELRDIERQLSQYEREEERLDARKDRLEEEAEERMTPIVEDAIRRGIARRD